MSRPRVVVLVVAAWTLPTVWTAVALLSGPSDGATLAGTRWGDSVVVSTTNGETPLRTGDTVLAIDDETLDESVTGSSPDRAAGDVVDYRIRRPAEGLDRELTIAVPLRRPARRRGAGWRGGPVQRADRARPGELRRSPSGPAYRL